MLLHARREIGCCSLKFRARVVFHAVSVWAFVSETAYLRHTSAIRIVVVGIVVVVVDRTSCLPFSFLRGFDPDKRLCWLGAQCLAK